MSTPQWRTILEAYERRISSGELAPGARIPGEEEIARDWNVSRQTVQKAVQELQRRGLVFRKRRWGTVVSNPLTPRKNRVALLVDLFAQEYGFPQPDLIRGIQEGLGDEIDLVIGECRHEGEREARMLRRYQNEVDGVILWPTNDVRNTPLIQRLVDEEFPIVVLDRIPEGLRCDAVVSDNEHATTEAMHRLEQVGHRRIGFFSFNKPELSSVLERHHAYVSSIAEVGIGDSSRFERWFYRDIEENQAQFAQMVEDAVYSLTTGPDAITALFCVQDSLAVAALRACERRGIRVPDDLEVATFNDWPASLYRQPWALYRIVQRMDEIGRVAAGLLTARLSGYRGEARVQRVRPHLIIPEASSPFVGAAPDAIRNRF